MRTKLPLRMIGLHGADPTGFAVVAAYPAGGQETDDRIDIVRWSGTTR